MERKGKSGPTERLEAGPQDRKDLEDWVTFTVEMLAEDPDAVQVHVKFRPARIKVLVIGPREQLGRIIGRDGKAVRHVRSVAQVMSRRFGYEFVDFDFFCPDEETSSRSSRSNGANHGTPS